MIDRIADVIFVIACFFTAIAFYVSALMYAAQRAAVRRNTNVVLFMVAAAVTWILWVLIR